MVPGELRWLTIDAAAEQLHLTPSYVLYLVRNGALGERRDGTWVANAQLVRERVRDREEWISCEAAAAIVGCTSATVRNHAHAGRIEQRSVPHRGVPSLRRASVEAFAEARAQAAAKRSARAAERGLSLPPDGGHVWLDTTTVALMLGISTTRVRQLARRESLPCVVRGGRRWFRRDHLEAIAAARAAQQSLNGRRGA